MKVTKAEQAQARERLREALRGVKVIYSLTSYGRGETDWVRLFVARGGEITELTALAARAWGERITNTPSRYGWRFGGGNYSKALDAAQMAVEAGGRRFSQTGAGGGIRWEEL